MDPLNIPVQLIRSNMKRLFLITGLDPCNDRFHSDILNAFLINNDPTSKYELLSPQHHIFHRNDKPALKPNVGILRTKWIDKYTVKRPAVVLIFVDLEWDDPNFSEKKTECESKINSLRQTIDCSEVKFLFILIQKRVTTGTPTHNERANELCTTCNIKREQILPLAVSEGIKPNIVAHIKKVVGDFSQQFYQVVHKKIRLRRVPENHVNLLIRNQFKLGYISELRNDLASALNFYKLAFDKFTEAKIPDEDKYEYLAVASIINYKICDIYFHRGNAIEAVTQFSRHEDRFMNKNKFNIGSYPSDLLAQIEFAKWCMKEYATFGHLFVEASNSVVLNTSVNPGKYFNSAGEFSEIANNLIKNLKLQLQSDNAHISTDVLLQNDKLEFFGQRPWRVNVSSSDSATEHHARIALEKSVIVDYEQSIIHFKRALVYLRKIEKCSRQIRVAELQLAIVLAQQKNFEGSLAIAEGAFRIMKDGLGLCHSIFILLYELYFALCEPVKLIQIVLQMMNRRFMNSSVFRQKFGQIEECSNFLMITFNNICQRQSPPLLSNVLTMLDNNEKNELLLKWQQVLNQKFRADMTALDTVITARGSIKSDYDVISNEKDAISQIKIENKFILPFTITKANFVFEIFSPIITPQNPDHFFNYSIDGFILEPNDFNLFCVPLNPISSNFSAGCEVTIASIELYFGNDFCLQYDNRHFNYLKYSSINPISCKENIRIIRSEYPILLNKSNDDKYELLKDEIRPVTFVLKNNGSLVLSDIKLNFRINDKSKDVLLYDDEGKSLQTITKTFSAKLNAEKELTFNINLCFLSIGEKGLSVDMSVLLHTANPSHFNKSYLLTFEVFQPFTPHVKAINNETIVEYFLEGTKTNLEVYLHAASNCNINGYKFELINAISGNCYEKINAIIKTNDSYILKTECLPKKLPVTSKVPLGQVSVFWKREISLKEVTTVYDLGNISIIKAPISLSVDLGGKSDHIIYKVIPVTFTIRNLLDIPLNLKFNVLRSDVFMFAGTNDIQFTLEAGQIQHKNFAFVANVVGELPFPKIHLECVEDTFNVIENYVLMSLPKTILILPSSKPSDVSISVKRDRHTSA